VTEEGRFRRGGRRFVRLRARQSADREWCGAGDAAGKRGHAIASFWIHLPMGYGRTMWNPRLNWKFYTEPEPNMQGRRIYWPSRAHAWRIQFDQRADRHSRSGRGLRSLAQAREYRLGLARRAALFSQAGNQCKLRRRPAAWRARSAACEQHPAQRRADRRRHPDGPSHVAFRATTTSTGCTRKASVTTSSPRETAGA